MKNQSASAISQSKLNEAESIGNRAAFDGVIDCATKCRTLTAWIKSNCRTVLDANMATDAWQYGFDGVKQLMSRDVE